MMEKRQPRAKNRQQLDARLLDIQGKGMCTSINGIEDIQTLRREIRDAAATTCRKLMKTASCSDSLELLAGIKFEEIGRHPIELRPLNVVEQVNQTFTYLVSLAAAEEILRRHPGAAPIVLNLGTRSGTDLESATRSVAAEVFAAVKPSNNEKLAKDIARVAKAPMKHKYVFYFSPNAQCGEHRFDKHQDVVVVALSREQMMGERDVSSRSS